MSSSLISFTWWVAQDAHTSSQAFVFVFVFLLLFVFYFLLSPGWLLKTSTPPVRYLSTRVVLAVESPCLHTLATAVACKVQVVLFEIVEIF